MLYSNPEPCAGEETTMVAVFAEQVGVTVTPAVGAAGGVAAVTFTAVAGEIQVLSAVLLTVILCDPGATPVNVDDAW